MKEHSLTVGSWVQAGVARVRQLGADRLTGEREERGAATLEYVVIAAAVFVAAVALVGVIIGVIEREQSRIE